MAEGKKIIQVKDVLLVIIIVLLYLLFKQYGTVSRKIIILEERNKELSVKLDSVKNNEVIIREKIRYVKQKIKDTIIVRVPADADSIRSIIFGYLDLLEQETSKTDSTGVFGTQGDERADTLPIPVDKASRQSYQTVGD
jgi:hypothetical protein